MATSTVVLAREDLSIPGALEPNNAGINSPEQVENQFFNILDQHKADAVVLDLMASQGHGVAAIRRIRRGSALPIVVLCHPEDRRKPAYRRAGALTCMSPPIDLIQLRETVLPSTQRSAQRPAAAADRRCAISRAPISAAIGSGAMGPTRIPWPNRAWHPDSTSRQRRELLP